MSEWIDCPKCGRNHENMTACIWDVKQPEDDVKVEQRRGATGVWTFVLKHEDGHIVARSELGTNYDFAEAQWNALKII